MAVRIVSGIAWPNGETFTRDQAEQAGWNISYRDGTRRWVAKRGPIVFADPSIEKVLEQVARAEAERPAMPTLLTGDARDLQLLRTDERMRADWQRSVNEWVKNDYARFCHDDEHKPTGRDLEMQRRSRLLTLVETGGPLPVREDAASTAPVEETVAA